MSVGFTPGPSDAEMDIALSEAGFVHGAQVCREMLARFVENSPPTDMKVLAGSIRANWHPGWGVDPGRLSGEIPDNPLGDLAEQIEILDIEREADAALRKARGDLVNPSALGGQNG